MSATVRLGPAYHSPGPVAGHMQIDARDAGAVVVDRRRDAAVHAGPERATADIPDVEIGADASIKAVIPAHRLKTPVTAETARQRAVDVPKIAAIVAGVIGVAAAQRA